MKRLPIKFLPGFSVPAPVGLKATSLNLGNCNKLRFAVLARRSVGAAAQDGEPTAAADLNLTGNWAGHINEAWSRGAGSTLELARVVWVARDQLPYGEWTRLWKLGVLPFSKRKGEMLAAIGKNLGCVDAQTFANLPWGWSILYCLARLNRGTFELLVKKGVIHPGLTLQEARQLLTEPKGEPKSKMRKNVRQRLQRFADFIRNTVNDWPPGVRELVKTELTRLIEELDAGIRVRPEGEFHTAGAATLSSNATELKILNRTYE